MLAVSQEHLKRKYHLRAQGFNLDRIASRVSTLIGVDQGQIWGPGKERNRVKARSFMLLGGAWSWNSDDGAIQKTWAFRIGVGLSVRRGEILVGVKAVGLSMNKLQN